VRAWGHVKGETKEAIARGVALRTAGYLGEEMIWGWRVEQLEKGDQRKRVLRPRLERTISPFTGGGGTVLRKAPRKKI